MSTDMTYNTTSLTFKYVIPFGNILVYGVRAYDRSAVNNFFIGVMLASSRIRASSLDVWGNVKVPRIEHYEAAADPDSQGIVRNRYG
jgi:hypothetical protein